VSEGSTNRSSIPRLLPLLLFGSGFCALVYQTVWLREFRLIFGASTLATSAVLAIFMGCLGAGSLVLGRRADQRENGLAWYGTLEILIAICAAATPLLLLAVRALYFAVGGSLTLGATGATLLRLLLSVVVLGAPTFLMGGTLPAATRGLTASGDSSRTTLALLYGANTLGAVAGTVVSTFWMLELFGNRQTLFAAAALNLLVAITARSLSRSVMQNQAAAATIEEDSSIEAPRHPMFVLISCAVVGFAFLLMELVWYRMLTPLLGGSTFTFGLILAVALLGIGIGGFLYSSMKRARSIASFAATCALEAICIVIPYAVGDKLAVFAALLRPLRGLGFTGQLLGWTLVTLFVVLPAAIVAGYQFPLIVALLGRGRTKIGQNLGDAYAWNTAGSIVGSLVGGFFLIPALGATNCWRLVVFTLAILAICAGALHLRARLSAFAAVVAAGAIALAVLPVGPTAAWRHSPIGAGRVHLETSTLNDIRQWLHIQRSRVVWGRDGVESSIALANSDGYAFLVNGKSDGDSRADAGTQVMAGLIAALRHPHPVSSLVIGLGTGSTAGWLGQVPGMKQVDVYELEPVVRDVAAASHGINGDVLHNPRVRVHYGDARELLLVSDQKYDVIFSEPSNPFRAGVASLFTREYYEAVRSRLHRGGIFAQWVQAYEIDAETMRTIYATVHSVFPNIETWQSTERDLILVASESLPPYDTLALQQRLADPAMAAATSGAWRTRTVEGFTAHYVANERFAQALAANGVINTDDRNIVEFGFARTVGKADLSFEQFRNAVEKMGSDRPSNLRGALDGNRVAAESAISPTLSFHVNRRDRASQAPALAASAMAFYRGQFSAIRPVGAEMLPPSASVINAMRGAAMGDEAAVAAALGTGEINPIERSVVLAQLLYRQKRASEAAEQLIAAFLAYRTNPWPDPRFMRYALAFTGEVGAAVTDPGARERLLASLSQPFSLDALGLERRRVVIQLEAIIDGSGCSRRQLQHIRSFEPDPFWEERFLSMRARCYALNHDSLAERAADDLIAFYDAEPEKIDPSVSNPQE
jgi:spermidine synthase